MVGDCALDDFAEKLRRARLRIRCIHMLEHSPASPSLATMNFNHVLQAGAKLEEEVDNVKTRLVICHVQRIELFFGITTRETL